MVMVVMVVVRMVAVRRYAELRHDVADPNSGDAAVLCVEHCGAGGACARRSKLDPFDHMCMVTLTIMMRSVCAPRAVRAVRSDILVSNICCASGRKR